MTPYQKETTDCLPWLDSEGWHFRPKPSFEKRLDSLYKKRVLKEHRRRILLFTFGLLVLVSSCCLWFIWWAMSQPYPMLGG